MLGNSFKKLLSQLDLLTHRQRQVLLSALVDKSHIESINLIESHFQDAGSCCSHCQSTATIRWGKSHGLQRYRCKACSKTFNALTGSSLSKLHHKEQWLGFSQCLLESRSVRESAKQCGIDPSTAFRWRHRFLAEPSQDKNKKMIGIVEADEAFFTESCKGNRHLQRLPRKRGKYRTLRASEHLPVLMVRDRTGTEADFVFKKIEKNVVHDCLKPLMGEEIILCTDGNSIYSTFAKDAQIPHKRIIRSDKVYVVEDIFHIQNVNAYISRLKNWLRRFNGIATRYLDNYLGWRRLLEKKGVTLSEEVVLRCALGVNYQQVMQT